MAQEPRLTGTAGRGATAAAESGVTVVGDGSAPAVPGEPGRAFGSGATASAPAQQRGAGADLGAGFGTGPGAELGFGATPGLGAGPGSGIGSGHPGRRARWPAPVAGVLALVLAALVLFGVLLDGGRKTAAALVDAAARTGAPADAGTDRKPDPVPTPTRLPGLSRDELVQLAARQTAALAGRDLAAFLEPYAADRPELVAERTRLFGNLLKIPFTVAEYRLLSAVPAAAESTGDRRTSTMTVVFSHQITGVDIVPIAETYEWTVTREAPGAPLRITKADGGSESGRGNSTYPAPWDSAELVVVDKPHVLLLAAKRQQAKAATWAARAETAATRNLSAWKSAEKTPQRFVVYLTPDRASFEQVRGGDSVTTNAIGVCLSLPPDPNVSTGTAPDFAGSRIYVDSTSDDISDGAADDAVAIFRHEMGHAMVATFQKRVAGTAPPLWVAEGFAGYLEWNDRSLDRWYVPPARDLVRSGKFDGKLPTDAQIYAADAKTSASGYYFSMLAIRYIADKYGAAKADEFVLAVYRAPQETSVDAALKAATGLERAAFESKWAQYAKSKAG